METVTYRFAPGVIGGAVDALNHSARMLRIYTRAIELIQRTHSPLVSAAMAVAAREEDERDGGS